MKEPQLLHLQSADDGVYVAEEKIPEGPLARPRGNFHSAQIFRPCALAHRKICTPLGTGIRFQRKQRHAAAQWHRGLDLNQYQQGKNKVGGFSIMISWGNNMNRKKPLPFYH